MERKPKIVLTGCTGALGRKFIERYGDSYDILGISRGVSSTKKLNCNYVQADVATQQAFIIEAIKRWGTPDSLVTAHVSYDLSRLTDPKKSLRREFEVNFFSVVSITKLLLETFWMNSPSENLANNRSIVNLSSIVATQTINLSTNFGYGSYAATKSAMNTYSMYLSHEVQPLNIRVNTVAPCTFPTHVTTERVCDVVHRLATLGHENGQVIEICYDYERNAQPPAHIL